MLPAAKEFSYAADGDVLSRVDVLEGQSGSVLDSPSFRDPTKQARDIDTAFESWSACTISDTRFTVSS